MNRPHRTEHDRLAALSAEEQAVFAGQDAPALLAKAEQLLHRVDRLTAEVGEIRAKVKAIEVYADRALRSVRRLSVIVERPGGGWFRWTRHLDGTGFDRQPVPHPVRGEGVPP